MSKSIGIAKKLRAIYEEDPSLFDKYSPEELIQYMHSIPNEPDEVFDEDPVELARYGYRNREE